MNTNTLATLILVTLCGCATPRGAVIDGQEVPRPTIGYTDHDLFAIQHKRAWPQARGASSGLRADGGTVWGRVCGADVILEASYHKSWLGMSGFVTPARAKGTMINANRAVQFEARDKNGMREVIGYFPSNNLKSLYGPPVIDFKYDSETLTGQIGWKHFQLHREGDRWVGTVTEIGETSPFAVDGVDELWSMPAPDQVALLPFMMTCADDHAYYRVSAPPDAQLPISFRDKSLR